MILLKLLSCKILPEPLLGPWELYDFAGTIGSCAIFLEPWELNRFSGARGAVQF